jgi:formylglycine-generating enzyme required for sulfatase activity
MGKELFPPHLEIVEHASRAETTTSRYYGATPELLGEYAWFLGNSQDRAWPGTRLKPNNSGLFDLYSSAVEWCSTVPGLYRLTGGQKPVDDTESDLVLTKGQDRVLRGASFYYAAADVRSANRYARLPGLRDGPVGLRVVRTYR